jgi:two-component system, chemotaxis family, chemotaxis protein CheY
MDVLIVDDSAAIRKILKRVLLQTEIPLGEVFEAADGCEALLRLGENPVQLIISDINMPNMDGLQLLAKIKSTPEWKGIPVVMVTTEGSQQKVLAAIELGAVGYVKKPFNADQIKQTLVGIM